MQNVMLFEDIFKLSDIDPDGKKFDKVSRIEAKSERFEMFMQLDINTEIYPMRKGDRFTLALASTLNLDGTPDSGYYMALSAGCAAIYCAVLILFDDAAEVQGSRKSLADKYEYVMHGKLYQISEYGSGKGLKAEMNISYGGLLMLLRGDPSNFSRFELDQRLFLLIRKL